MTALTELGCEAIEIQRAGLNEVTYFLEQDRPLIAFIQLEDFVSGISGSHAVVVAGVDDHCVSICDPSSGVLEHFQVRLFLDAWQSRGGEAIVILDVDRSR